MRRTAFLLFLPPLVLLILISSLVYHIFFASNNFKEKTEQIVLVSRGATFLDITDSLASHGVIENKTFFLLTGKLFGWDTQLKIGKYLFTDGVSNFHILKDLKERKASLIIPVTIPEGSSTKHIAGIFSHQLGIDSTKFLVLVYDSTFAHEFDVEGKSLHAYLLPETYHFYWQPEEIDIIKQMVSKFFLFFNDSLRARAKELGFTLNQILTMASIVEWEAKIDSERAIIAGVYYNRIRKNMKLEADPTIQFLIEGRHRPLLYRDLRIESPYNTYLYRGLPPAPINNPGKKAILAVLNPGKHRYLFFVTTGKGGHHFSRTYQEHLRAVWKYRRLRKESLLKVEKKENPTAAQGQK